jgi:surfactin synthase thioesterase subunit
MAFQPWRSHLPAGLEVRAAQLPGRWTDPGPPLTDLDAIVAALLADLRPLLDRPWALFGASLGGLVAFELIRAVRREGGPPPAHLIVAGAAAPDRAHPLLAQAGELRHALAGDGDPVALARLGLVPEAQVSPDLLPLVLPALRADLELVLRHTFHPEPPLACPITALRGAGDTLVDRAAVAAWVAHTGADFTLRELAGGHLFYRERPAATWETLAPLVTATTT